MNNNFYAVDREFFCNYMSELKELKASHSFTAEELKSMSLEEAIKSIDRVLEIKGTEATIFVSGMLKPKLDIFDIYFGLSATSYDQIIRAIEQVNDDESITDVKMVFNTPGGYVVGVTNTADFIRESKKPIKAVVTDLCASAGIWLASQCSEIALQNDSSTMGSVGVFATYMKENNENIYEFRSENAPYKNLGADDAVGSEKIQQRVNALEEIFINYIVKGRRLEVDYVKENFGKGDTMLAQDAVNAKMADKILNSLNDATPSTEKINNNQEDSEMEAKEMQDIIAGALKPMQDQIVALSGKVEASDKANKEAAEKAEQEKAIERSFDSILAKYPEQKALIATEKAKGLMASCDFVITVASAEDARLKAIDKADGSDETGEAKTAGTEEAEKAAAEENGKAYLASLGLNVKQGES